MARENIRILGTGRVGLGLAELFSRRTRGGRARDVSGVTCLSKRSARRLAFTYHANYIA
jgi:hypothetical protein